MFVSVFVCVHIIIIKSVMESDFEIHVYPDCMCIPVILNPDLKLEILAIPIMYYEFTVMFLKFCLLKQIIIAILYVFPFL